MISYPLVKWFALFATNQKPIFNLAAGVMHASKTAADKQFIKETTEKIKTMVFLWTTSLFLLNCLVEILYPTKLSQILL